MRKKCLMSVKPTFSEEMWSLPKGSIDLLIALSIRIGCQVLTSIDFQLIHRWSNQSYWYIISDECVRSLLIAGWIHSGGADIQARVTSCVAVDAMAETSNGHIHPMLRLYPLAA